MSRFVLALDQGTTSSRAIIFDREGRIVSMAQREFAQHFPQPGWVEHDAEEIWRTQESTAAEALRAAGAAARDIAAIGVANQRETTVLWDRATGEPISRAIVWQDRRTASLCDELRARGQEELVTATTGLLLDPYFSGTKIGWLLDHIPGVRVRAERGEICFGTIDSWLTWKLTGGREHITDHTNASRTLLMNLQTGDWDDRLLELLGVPRACLPKILPSSLPRGIPATVAGVSAPLGALVGDQQAALFGQACFAPGMAKNTYGTGCFLLMHAGNSPPRSSHRLLTTLAATQGPLQYALEGSVFTGGSTVQWLRDGLRIIDAAVEVEGLAASVENHGGVYLVPAFTGLGSPYWDPQARGTLLGLTRGSSRGHIARAALEAIAFQSAEVLQCMQADTSITLAELRVDGGASRNDLLMQFQADLLGVAVLRPQVTETTALGAAYLAGLGQGFWSAPDEVTAGWRIERRFEPRASRDYAASRMAEWRRAVERARSWVQ